jgi:hypothetical protein
MIGDCGGVGGFDRDLVQTDLTGSQPQLSYKWR